MTLRDVLIFFSGGCSRALSIAKAHDAIRMQSMASVRLVGLGKFKSAGRIATRALKIRPAASQSQKSRNGSYPISYRWADTPKQRN